MQGVATRVSAFRVTLRAAVDKILQVGLPYLQNIQLRDGLQTAVAMAGVAAAWRILARCIELQRMMTAAAEQQALATEQLATAVIALRSTVEGHIYQAKAAEFIALARTHAVASDWDEPYRGTNLMSSSSNHQEHRRSRHRSRHGRHCRSRAFVVVTRGCLRSRRPHVGRIHIRPCTLLVLRPGPLLCGSNSQAAAAVQLVPCGTRLSLHPLARPAACPRASYRYTSSWSANLAGSRARECAGAGERLETRTIDGIL
jgi:hypothetical protein